MTDKLWLGADAEVDAAMAIEAGVLAAAALAEGRDVGAGEEELACLVRLGETATARLLAAHSGLVRFVVSQEYRGFGCRDDLQQEGWLALAEAVRRFDHRRGRFATYALTAVRAAVRVAIARDQGLSERQGRGLRRIRETEAVLAQSLGRHATHDEVAAVLRRGVEWVSWCSRRGEATRPDLLEEIPAADPVGASGGDLPDPGLARRALRTLPGPERTVVGARFPARGEPRSYADLAAELRLSQATVRRLERRGLDTLRRLLSQWETAAA